MNTRSAINAGKKAVTTGIAWLLRVQEPRQLRAVDRLQVTIIPPNRAQRCFACRCTSDAIGDQCPVCQERGTLLSVDLLLSGKVEFILAENNA